jgi:nucleoid-associated protein YgaU
VRVRSGDCLWTIATGLAPPGADDDAIAGLADRLYAANRQVVGDDPDLIYPGTVLRAPGGSR